LRSSAGMASSSVASSAASQFDVHQKKQAALL
jgi:hypothetical protein